MRVAAIYRFPVKSMLGESLSEAELTPRGLHGDRAFGLIDVETGKVVSVKRPKLWGRIFELTATTTDGTVHVRFPDGTTVPLKEAERPLSDFFGREVRVASQAPAGATFDEVWAGELKGGARPFLGMDSRQEDDGELIDAPVSLGVPGGFFDFGAIHAVTTSTVRSLEAAAPRSRFDAKRFRPNLVIETADDGFVETGWQGRTLRVGGVRLPVVVTVPRCVMTTLEQGDLPADPDVLRTIAAKNRVEVLGAAYPCAGIYTDVAEAGVVRVGDPVTLE